MPLRRLRRLFARKEHGDLQELGEEDSCLGKHSYRHRNRNIRTRYPGRIGSNSRSAPSADDTSNETASWSHSGQTRLRSRVQRYPLPLPALAETSRSVNIAKPLCLSVCRSTWAVLAGVCRLPRCRCKAESEVHVGPASSRSHGLHWCDVPVAASVSRRWCCIVLKCKSGVGGVRDVRAGRRLDLTSCRHT